MREKGAKYLKTLDASRLRHVMGGSGTFPQPWGGVSGAINAGAQPESSTELVP
jgi:hypothetical protein